MYDFKRIIRKNISEIDGKKIYNLFLVPFPSLMNKGKIIKLAFTLFVPVFLLCNF